MRIDSVLGRERNRRAQRRRRGAIGRCFWLGDQVYKQHNHQYDYQPKCRQHFVNRRGRNMEWSVVVVADVQIAARRRYAGWIAVRERARLSYGRTAGRYVVMMLMQVCR